MEDRFLECILEFVGKEVSEMILLIVGVLLQGTFVRKIFVKNDT